MLLLVLALLVGIPFNPFLERESRESQKALSAYKEGDYIEALTRFQAARKAAEDPSVYDYNLGVAAQKAQNPEAAVGYYLKARGSDAVSPGLPDYNRGTALAQLEKPQDALTAFRQALRADPNNEDARYNYEVLLKQMQADSSQGGNDDKSSQDQSKSSSDSQKNKDDSQKNPGEDQQNKPQEGDQENGDQQQQPKPQPGQPDPSTDKEGDQPQANPAQPVPLDRQQAERLLNALMQGERDLLKSRLKGNHRKRAEKDW